MPLIILTIIVILTIIIGIATTPWKMRIRKNRLERLNKCLSPSNRKLITDKDDLELLEAYVGRLEWYSNHWYYNSQPTYMYRNSRIRKMIKKYNLNLEDN